MKVSIISKHPSEKSVKTAKTIIQEEYKKKKKKKKKKNTKPQRKKKVRIDLGLRGERRQIPGVRGGKSDDRDQGPVELPHHRTPNLTAEGGEGEKVEEARGQKGEISAVTATVKAQEHRRRQRR